MPAQTVDRQFHSHKAARMYYARPFEGSGAMVLSTSGTVGQLASDGSEESAWVGSILASWLVNFLKDFSLTRLSVGSDRSRLNRSIGHN